MAFQGRRSLARSLAALLTLLLVGAVSLACDSRYKQITTGRSFVFDRATSGV